MDDLIKDAGTSVADPEYSEIKEKIGELAQEL